MTTVEAMVLAFRRPDLLHGHVQALRFDPHMHSTYSFGCDIESRGRACRWIGQKYMRAIRTDNIARELGIHKSHFIGAFECSMVSRLSLDRQLRIARAAEIGLRWSG